MSKYALLLSLVYVIQNPPAAWNTAFAEDTGVEDTWTDAPYLGNPMESQFSEPDTVGPRKTGKTTSRVRAAFSDGAFPDRVFSDHVAPNARHEDAAHGNAAHENATPVEADRDSGLGSKIVQTSAEGPDGPTPNAWADMSAAPSYATWDTVPAGQETVPFARQGVIPATPRENAIFGPGTHPSTYPGPPSDSAYSNTLSTPVASPFGTTGGNSDADMQNRLLAAMQANSYQNPYALANPVGDPNAALAALAAQYTYLPMQGNAIQGNAYGGGFSQLQIPQVAGNPYADPYALAAAQLQAQLPGQTPGGYTGVYTGMPYVPYGTPYGNPYADPYGGTAGMGSGPGGSIGPAGTADSYASIARHQQQLIARQQAFINAVKERGERENETGDREEGENGQEGDWSMDNLLPLKVSSPLAETMWAGAGYLSPFSNTDQPDKGVGQPLRMRSWTDRPYYFGAFCGYVSPATELMSGSLSTGSRYWSEQDSSGTGGLTLGWNFQHYWGIEGRLHFTSFNIHYYADGEDGERITALTGSNQLTTLDLSVHYYPLGNSKWRPYFKYGLGVVGVNFPRIDGTKTNTLTIGMPVGVGLKYWWDDRLAINLDIVDNVVFGVDGTKTQDNWGFTCGLTWAYGRNKSRRPTAYWPFTPSSKR